jgi:protocatechuate 3,4-dioxygenase beta subunit
MKEPLQTPCLQRRSLLLGLCAAGLYGIPAVAAVQSLTPRQPAGPFYPTELPLDDDSDLTRIAGRDETAAGELCDLQGRLLDRNGRPLGGLRIEIWQCDANGRYRHPRDPARSPIDPAFQGFGHALSNENGEYRFRTIKPVSYPGRTPHIHVAVRPKGAAPFVTQLYVADDPRNDGDFLYRRIPAEKRHLVAADFSRRKPSGGPLDVRWDIVLGETV